MARVIIPSLEFAYYEQEVTLDGTPCILVRKWNSRGEFWTISFLDRNRNPLILSVKIVVNYELIRWYPDRGLPPGQLYAIDERGGNDRIGRDDFTNGRLSLVYVTEDEL